MIHVRKTVDYDYKVQGGIRPQYIVSGVVGVLNGRAENQEILHIYIQTNYEQAEILMNH